jgi:CubicO group peptidase (beta-lactamase class C family)/D-alanyl-D-alanine dipeptidase
MRRFLALVLWAAWMQAACASAERSPAVAAEHAPLVARLEAAIAHEMLDKGLPAFSIALVDDQAIVWAQGFGEARPGVPATARTVYRVGSVSKLFTDVAVMQLVERGHLDLDVPVRTYVPEFAPENPSGEEITLRQLMCHRSGLVRESPLGNYFDPGEPSLEHTVLSLNDTRLVYAPTQRTKYSNAGVSVVGYVLERTQHEAFARYLRRAVLAPLGLQSSAFEPTRALTAELARGTMWSGDGRSFEAPGFELGTIPAGCMYSSVEDLGRFLAVLFNGGAGTHGRVLSAESLEEMWTPQFAAPGARSGFGLGFALSELDGLRRIGHGGAIYGFATDLVGLPDEKLGVAGVATLDGSNAVVERLCNYALSLMLAHERGEPLPAFTPSEPVARELARRLAGRYVSEQDTVEIELRGGEPYLTRRDRRVRLRSSGGRLIVDDRLGYGMEVSPGANRLEIGGRVYARAPLEKPAPAPERWLGLIGEYGWDHNTLFVHERDGRLYALIEWFFDYPLAEESRDVFAFPDFGLYHGEKLLFERDAAGRALRVVAAEVAFERRATGPESGETFRIAPIRPVDELRREALKAKPPREGSKRASELVDLAALDPTLRFDVRYASGNNFMSTVFYPEARALLQRPAAEALLRAQRALAEHGFGLLIHDAYRPWYVTKMFWEATPPEQRMFVADPAEGSRHNRGCAVDLTLCELATGRPVVMVGVYDEMTPRSYPYYPGGTSLQRWQRDLLRRAMEVEGFSVYEFEWWHFDFQGWESYPILNQGFETIAAERVRAR